MTPEQKAEIKYEAKFILYRMIEDGTKTIRALERGIETKQKLFCDISNDWDGKVVNVPLTNKTVILDGLRKEIADTRERLRKEKELLALAMSGV